MDTPKPISSPSIFERDAETSEKTLAKHYALAWEDLFLQLCGDSLDAKEKNGDAKPPLIDFAEVPKTIRPRLTFEKENSEQITDTQDDIARQNLLLQLFGGTSGAETKGGAEERGPSVFARASQIIIPYRADEEEEENSDQVIEDQDDKARRKLLFELFEDTTDVQAKGGVEEQKSSQLAKPSSKDDITIEERRTFEGPSDILPRLLDFLIPYLEGKETYKTIIPLFEEAFHKNTLNKGQRDNILGTLSNKGTCTSSGSKMPPEVQDTAYLLKTFGWLYLNDGIDGDKVPEHLKIKKRRSKSPQKKSSDTSILSELKKIEAAYQESDLGTIARFFLDEIEKHGRFELRYSKYYYIKI